MCSKTYFKLQYSRTCRVGCNAFRMIRQDWKPLRKIKLLGQEKRGGGVGLEMGGMESLSQIYVTKHSNHKQPNRVAFLVVNTYRSDSTAHRISWEIHVFLGNQTGLGKSFWMQHGKFEEKPTRFILRYEWKKTSSTVQTSIELIW